MATFVEITNTPRQVISGLDNVIIPECLEDIKGGRSLDMEGWDKATVIPAGLPVIVKDGVYKPMPLASEEAIGTLPDQWQYAGILRTSIPANAPMAAIMVRGTVNTAAVKFPLTSILAALQTALPLIRFTQNEE